MATGNLPGPGVRLSTGAPAELERIISKCLENDTGRRYQHAADIRSDLEQLKRDTDSARPKANPKRPALTLSTRRWPVITLAAAVVLALSIAAFRYAHGAPKLTDKDTIVLANFTNTTGDPVFDGTLRQGLSVQLEQSPFLSIISDQQIQQTLQMMGRKPDTRLTPEIARELCQRTGSAAVLEGSIAQVGTPYLLTVKAVNCASGETLASTEAQAGDKSHVLDALGETASEIRHTLGESLGTVQKFDTPLEQATTPSLEALKAFSSGCDVMRTESPSTAIPLFKQAIRLDPNFAAAYAWLGIMYTSLGEPAIAVGYTRKAYELRDRTSEPEKYFISAVYYKEVTGNIPQAVESCKLWIQAYPRMEMPHTYLAGAIYPVLGEYDKGVEESREAIRLSPTYPIPYAFDMFNAMASNRLDEAKIAYEQAVERRLHSALYPGNLYRLAFLEHDAAGMARQVTKAGGQPSIEDDLLKLESDSAAYSGRLQSARKVTHQAIDTAEQAGEKEAAATYLAASALREGLLGNAGEARRRATQAMEQSPGVDARYGSALALAYAGDEGRVRVLMADLNKSFPEATIVQFNYLPTLRAKLALMKGDSASALEYLSAAAPYELGQSTYSIDRWTSLYPVYVRGEAYLAAHQASEAAAEFQDILDHPGIVVNEPIGALAHLQLGRAYAMEAGVPVTAVYGRRPTPFLHRDWLRAPLQPAALAKARAAYQAFLTLWKDADPDIPILREAKAEYARLH